ncbi:MAG: energy-coupling factor ABC transporter permease [Candidatus Eisenbacteria bacterium]|uniref:Energy-coupling factor ABC transporter permease n=1 Tax=Eiseniibacteriota bacterium TaxID=2212470 RepID=A0A948W7L0_UNCEI|nr:energy-coupling factor ABC transporter permease [Candidatus Eisenbacteria bacterium]MBU1947561.1 energy-coupling factor ABC transporter permease [Candidatus Eisenbacteria bacterium]MBU2692709.1 energy-coupling factor ABC transporter permease [Candidatus Eisenbacteria bacterium]
MHIPDGFITPKIYLPAYAICAGLWSTGARYLRSRLRSDILPHLSVMTALAFVLMMIAVPLPGGTSAHASGIAVLAVLFGFWTAFLATSLVLLLQALLFGSGGITTLPVNAIAMGLLGGMTAWSLYKALSRFNNTIALFAAGWTSVVVPAVFTAVILGLQPVIAHSSDGTPLFFPFGLSITLPAIILPHCLIGIGEGFLTVLICRFYEKLKPPAAP